MTYCIKRETLIPWDCSSNHFVLHGDVYDIVEAQRDSGLEKVADYILDNNVVVKTPFNESQNDFVDFVDAYESVNGKIQELLLG